MRLAYWMYEGTAHHGVGRLANSMRNVHAVFHAPQGDDYVTTIFTMLERTPNFPAMTTSVVSGRDLAEGTIRLPETLRQVEARCHPDLIVVVASCSTTLLQENLEVAAASAGLGCEVMVYDANPYRMQEIVAADNLFAELVRRYAAPAPLTPLPSVNILGPASLGFHARHDLISLRRMLKTLGVEVNVVAPWGASLDDLRRLPAAWVNIAPYRELGLKAARYLESQFGTPALTDAPIGVQPTLRWLNALVDALNVRARQQRGEQPSLASSVSPRANASPLQIPPLTAFSLDGMSAPSAVPWFARTADMESFSAKTAFVFGNATHTVGVAKFVRDELGMQLVGAGTYLKHEAAWVREQLQGYLSDDALLFTDTFQDVARRIGELRPDLVCGTQMERHTGRKYDLNCMVISPPTHIENHLLGYRPFLGFDGADVIADEVYTTCTLGMEKHLIDMFGDAGLDAGEGSELQVAGSTAAEAQPATFNLQPAPEPQPATFNLQPAPEPQLAHRGPLPPNAVVTWDDSAEKMLKKVPFFVRSKVRGNVEKYARERGLANITAEVLVAAKEHIGG